ncbi:bifunctional tetrahydrofolate synthase/dihydrofolate synthase [Vreelandella rituensis]|uniref:Dihydrofolate synthase/folylpolyglutamate synthase n=2 Tax=Vreelandella rituensis TaxID=2282306 RepID=A0A368U0X0_9GAMM|nr:bifunctional tetrahydrofolate synthase/dihydrofolate synthase [Halomonas rituensis]
MPDTLNGWLRYLETLHPVGIDMGLERVAAVADRMGLRKQPLAASVITIAGTNGKGSTLAMVDRLARAHGLSVGTYTSPHLLHYNERICLDGINVTDDYLIKGFEQVEHARLQDPAISLTYFEAGTLCALWCLGQSALDLVVLEVGLGGRLDAVNILDADVAVVTTIAQDHAGFLGTDIEQIGREKAGIFRPARPAVLGSTSLPVSVRQTAEQLGAPVYALGESFSRHPHAAGWAWQGMDQSGQAITLKALPDPGLPLDNAATALQALTLSGVSLSEARCREALADVRVPGRMQWVGQWCLDVGHNPHAAAYVAGQLEQKLCTGRTWALLGMLEDKDAEGVIDALAAVVTHWVCVDLEGERGRSATDLAQRLEHRGLAVSHIASTPAQGAHWLGTQLNESDRVLATGSFVTVAELLGMALPQAVTLPVGEGNEIRHD